MARVLLESVYKRFGDAEVVCDVSLDIADGEMVVLVGPSGCGKTTTLRMIAGLEEISEGRISIGERQVNDLPPKDRDIAMVFQSYALYPHMTVRENLAFGLKVRKHPRADIAARVNEAAKMLDLESLLDRRPRALSGGQRQRVAMGRAVVRRPAVFLFDEPLSNLDAKLRARMRTELSRLHARLGTTCIYVTHDQVEAMTLADRIVVMRDGAVQQVGTPLELYEQPHNRFVAGFIGTPAMNFVRGQLLRDSGAVLSFVAEGIELPLPGEIAERLEAPTLDEVLLGIRPCDIQLASGGDDAAQSIAARVDVQEPLGAESYLHLDSACGNLVARVDSRNPAREGDAVAVTLPPQSLHFFDGATEASLL